MSPKEFRAILKQTLADLNFSRSEKRALSSVLDDVQPAQTELNLYRSVAFELARESLQANLDQSQIIEWLEDVIRLLKPAQEDGTTVSSEAYFSPGNHCRNRIRSLLRQSRTSVDICVFTITDDEIAEAIAEAHHRRIQVRIITDNEKSTDTGSDVDRLEEIGVAVRHDNSPYHMHHKFAILDNSILLSGSYNWTRSAATQNEENIVVQDDSHLVKKFGEVFEDLWQKYH